MIARGRRSTASRQNSRRFTVRFSLVNPLARKINKCCPSYCKIEAMAHCFKLSSVSLVRRTVRLHICPVYSTSLLYVIMSVRMYTSLPVFTAVCLFVYLSDCLYTCIPASVSRSVSAFPIPIRIRIQESKINACIRD